MVRIGSKISLISLFQIIHTVVGILIIYKIINHNDIVIVFCNIITSSNLEQQVAAAGFIKSAPTKTSDLTNDSGFLTQH
jgi:hypothetical protein